MSIPNLESPFLDAARKLGRLLNDEAEAAVKQGHLTQPVVDALIKAKFASMAAPKEFGGAELSYPQWAAVLEELARADGAAGWCLQAISSHGGAFSSILPQKRANELFGGKEFARIAGMAGPRGRADVTGDGYTFTGKYQFASGSSWGTHFVGGGIVFDNGEMVMAENGAPRMVAAVVPRDQVTEKGNWDVLGLEATASIDYEFGPIYFDADAVVDINPWPAKVQRGAAFWSLGFDVLGGNGHSPVALGVARRALEEIALLAPNRKRVDGPFATVGDQPHFQHEFVSLDAELRSARLAFYDNLETLEAWAGENEGPATPELTAHSKQIVRHLHDVAIRAVDFAFYWSGSAGLRNGHPIGRAFRDMHVINQHIIVDRHLFIDSAPALLGVLGEGALEYAN